MGAKDKKNQKYPNQGWYRSAASDKRKRERQKGPHRGWGRNLALTSHRRKQPDQALLTKKGSVSQNVGKVKTSKKKKTPDNHGSYKNTTMVVVPGRRRGNRPQNSSWKKMAKKGKGAVPKIGPRGAEGGRVTKNGSTKP